MTLSVGSEGDFNGSPKLLPSLFGDPRMMNQALANMNLLELHGSTHERSAVFGLYEVYSYSVPSKAQSLPR
eukprot:1956002-Amphidinium_carterae.1